MYVRFDEQGHFIRCALAPAAALDFVQHCIPLFSVDMSHLYMNIKWQLALATAIDGNRQIMPVQWGIVPIENKNEWFLFFKLMKEMFGHFIHSRNIFFIRDRQKGSRAAFKEVFHFDVLVMKPLQWRVSTYAPSHIVLSWECTLFLMQRGL